MSPGSSAQSAQPGLLLPPAHTAAATSLRRATAPHNSVCLPPVPCGKGKDAPSPPLHFPLNGRCLVASSSSNRRVIGAPPIDVSPLTSQSLRSPHWPIKGTTISLFHTTSHCTTPLCPSLLLASCPRKDSPPPLHHHRRPVSAIISPVAAHGQNRHGLPPILALSQRSCVPCSATRRAPVECCPRVHHGPPPHLVHGSIDPAH
jgi:hypothetical protein